MTPNGFIVYCLILFLIYFLFFRQHENYVDPKYRKDNIKKYGFPDADEDIKKRIQKRFDYNKHLIETAKERQKLKNTE